MILCFDLGNLMFQDRMNKLLDEYAETHTVANHDFRSGVEETAKEIDGYLERILERRSHAKSKQKEKLTDKDQKEAKEIEQCKALRDAAMKELKSKKIPSPANAKRHRSPDMVNPDVQGFEAVEDDGAKDDGDAVVVTKRMSGVEKVAAQKSQKRLSRQKLTEQISDVCFFVTFIRLFIIIMSNVHACIW